MNQKTIAAAAFFLIAATLSILLPSCEQNLFKALTPEPKLTPREAYFAALDSSGLADTQMAKAWRLAGVRALEDSLLLKPPFQEAGYFRAEVPAAQAYRLMLRQGEVLEMQLATSPDSLLFFVDLFQIVSTDSTRNFVQVFNAENYKTDSMTYEVVESGTYLLRIQPELLVSGRYKLQLISRPAYGTFPVSGKGNPDIWSFYGDPRDGGKRDHQGIDIFARRGTPVVASVDGVIRSVRDRGLGGKQVWLSDPERHQSLYYAHLDTQLVREGQQVKAGDTLGLVGNTGNARSTRPHLHFGIYRRRHGAIDPFPFVALQTANIPAIRADTARLGQPARIRRSATRLSAAPENKGKTVAVLDRHLPVEVIAANEAWYRIRSADGFLGYVPANGLEDMGQAIGSFTLAERTELLELPSPDAGPVAILEPEEQVTVIGKKGTYQLVRNVHGQTGWVVAVDM